MRLDDIGADALLHLDGDGRLAVEPGDRLGILEGRADRGEVAARTTAFGPATTGRLATSSGVSISDGTLIAYLPSVALDGAGGDQAVGGADALDQLIEPQPVGRQLHRIDDRLDQIVARALDRAFQHARHLLDRSRSSRAAAVSTRSGTSPDSVTTSTGNSEMLTSVTVGSSAPCGRSRLASCTLLRVSSAPSPDRSTDRTRPARSRRPGRRPSASP